MLAMPTEARQALTQALEMLDTTTNRRKPRLLVDLARSYVQQDEIEAAWKLFDGVMMLRTPVPQRTSNEIVLCKAQATMAIGDLDRTVTHLRDGIQGPSISRARCVSRRRRGSTNKPTYSGRTSMH